MKTQRLALRPRIALTVPRSLLVMALAAPLASLGGCASMSWQARERQAQTREQQAQDLEGLREWREAHRVDRLRTPMGMVFAALAPHAGLDPTTVYVFTPDDYPPVPILGARGLPLVRLDITGFSAAAVGAHHFVISHQVDQFRADRCVLWGLAAHELAHDRLEHVETRAAWQGLAVAVPGGGLVGFLALPTWDRGAEREADAVGVAILERRGAPGGAVRHTLEYLMGRYGDRGGGWLARHPLTSERIAALPTLEDQRICAVPTRGR